MCLAIIKPLGQTVDWENLSEGFLANKDGSGYAYAINGKLKVGKGLWKWRTFKRSAFNANTNDAVALFHFRLATHGGVKPELCHPFKFTSCGVDYALVHNGVFSDMTVPFGESDTSTFTTNYIKFLFDRVEDPMNNVTLFEMVNRLIGFSNRVAILSQYGLWWQFGGGTYSSWTTIGGCIYSNTQFQRRSFFGPTTFQSGAAINATSAGVSAQGSANVSERRIYTSYNGRFTEYQRYDKATNRFVTDDEPRLRKVGEVWSSNDEVISDYGDSSKPKTPTLSVVPKVVTGHHWTEKKSGVLCPPSTPEEDITAVEKLLAAYSTEEASEIQVDAEYYMATGGMDFNDAYQLAFSVFPGKNTPETGNFID